MNKLILVVIVLALNMSSCGNDKNINNITTKDKKFLFETALGEKTECYLTFLNDGNQNSISNKELILLIKLSNRKIKENLLLPSSFKPLEYYIKQSAEWDGFQQTVIIRLNIRVSFNCKNRKGSEIIDDKELEVVKNLNENKFSFY
ncbi:hypothetical protein [Flavobacterium sp.]|uniref:hypothetical protein n=1 Tax=Flavobacterium sp. TaxID=239 RepID=UPI0025F931D6|nr:hypothetical protein [Flavobacterium sp.]